MLKQEFQSEFRQLWFLPILNGLGRQTVAGEKILVICKIKYK